MKKIIIIAAAFIGVSATANAQSNASSTAQQSVQLGLSNAVEITFTGNSSSNGASVSFPFQTVTDYANGVTSPEQELKIRSNKNFNVSVKAGASLFTYTGSVSPAPQMIVYSTLGLMVTENNTGGNVTLPYTMNNYFSITSVAQNVIGSATNGGDQRFKVKYRANPGFSYPAGTYTVDVIYTATQQ